MFLSIIDFKSVKLNEQHRRGQNYILHQSAIFQGKRNLALL